MSSSQMTFIFFRGVQNTNQSWLWEILIHWWTLGFSSTRPRNVGSDDYLVVSQGFCVIHPCLGWWFHISREGWKRWLWKGGDVSKRLGYIAATSAYLSQSWARIDSSTYNCIFLFLLPPGYVTVHASATCVQLLMAFDQPKVPSDNECTPTNHRAVSRNMDSWVARNGWFVMENLIWPDDSGLHPILGNLDTDTKHQWYR